MATPTLSPRPPGGSHPASRLQRSTPMPTPAAAAAATTTTLHPTAPLSPRSNGIAKSPGPRAAHTKVVMPATPSPNYFGLTVHSHADPFASSAAQHIRANWSPPTSDVRSTAAPSPRPVPVELHPDLEQFRRQSQPNRAFALGASDFASPAPAPPATAASATDQNPFFVPRTSPPFIAHHNNQTALKPRSPKRMLSSDTSLFPDRPRQNSPASFEGIARTDAIAQFSDDHIPHPSLPPTPSHPSATPSYRAETLPATLEYGHNTHGPTMVTAQHVVNILQSSVDEVLLLDLRVSTQYARARIAGALSLCIPTTLLKRASFNVQKLAETFKDEEQRDRFQRWRSSKHVVVYDASSAQLKDATTCVNTLNKFTSDGWNGGTFIIRGGFREFSEKFPSWVTHQASQSPTSGTAALTLGSDLPAVAPVIGGCPMPATQNAANPFFGNIRQNMDLIGGVGQMPVKHPEGMTRSMQEAMPPWLKRASVQDNSGKTVAEQFLAIEKREQKRMQEALSAQVSYGTPSGSHPAKHIQIAGIEKGSKNRYNNIWPFEHSRVKLQNVSEGSCDYVNANHVQAACSNKRYIATQGPIPATFKDFWNMVWQQDVRVIVMLTAEQEGGQIKAHKYWSDKRHGHLRLDSLSERRASIEPSRIHRHREQAKSTLSQPRATTNNVAKGFNLTKEATPESPSQEQPYVIVRTFTLSNEEEPFARMREITQLQYTHWPDFGAPAHPTHLLGLIEQTGAVVRLVNGSPSSQPEPTNSRPVLVHCSAGCGRTGTFCTVDSVLDMLKRQRLARNARNNSVPVGADILVKPGDPGYRENGDWITDEEVDLIARTVEDFRLQRLSMVQSLRQFVLCYESIMEWLVDQEPKST